MKGDLAHIEARESTDPVYSHYLMVEDASFLSGRGSTLVFMIWQRSSSTFGSYNQPRLKAGAKANIFYVVRVVRYMFK